VRTSAHQGRESTGSDRELELVSLSLYPSYLEVMVAGAHPPASLWARLGSLEVRLLKRDWSGPARLQMEGVREARYANTIALPLTVEAFNLGSDPSSVLATYEMRRGDRKGRSIVGLPETITCQSDDRVVSSPPETAAGRIVGWAFQPADPERKVSLELIEIPSSEVLTSPDDTSTLAKTIAKRKILDRYGTQAPPTTGFNFALPARILDGAEHDLCLVARDGENLQSLWHYKLHASPEWIDAQIRSCDHRAELREVLMALAKAARFDELAGYFANPFSYVDFPLSPEDAFEILSYARFVGGRGDGYTYLIQKFENLREFVFTEDSCQRLLLKSATSFLKSSDQDVGLRRFPHAPLAEALLDLVFVLEDSSDTRLLRDLVSFCMHSNRYVLARNLVERWMRQDSESPTPRVTAASIELATGNHEAAELLIDQALTLQPNFSDALLLLARIYARQGRPLHAVAACSGGRGLSHWLHSPPGPEVQKLLAPLDWPGLNAAIAQRSQQATLLQHISHADSLNGAPDRPDEGGFNLVFLDDAEWDVAIYYEGLRALGCVQIINQPGALMSEIEGVGRWTLIFAHFAADYLSPDLVRALFAQRRPFEPMVMLASSVLDEKGKPEEMFLCGVLVRTDILKIFGSCSLGEFVKRSEKSIRVKTLLI